MSSEKVNPVKEIFKIQKNTHNNQNDIKNKKEETNENFKKMFDEEKKIEEKERKKTEEKTKMQKSVYEDNKLMYNYNRVKKIKKDDDRERGSATVIVFVTVLFLLMILGTIFTTMALKNKSQLAELSELKKAYDGDMESIYNERNNGIYKFNFTGGEQTFVASKAGYYLLETWGASGGNATSSSGEQKVNGGYGSYSQGVVKLSQNQTLYINVAGAGENGTGTTIQTGGYNGGGKGNYHGGSGGGATHIATVSGLLSNLSDSLSSIIIVSAGGRRSRSN